ncbi:Mu transposase C-terminal domain-containing protein [Aliarcobacter butzleri]|uniref:helix-turn-helix domain-containing protein n=1 Tax=Aliarcobacter butzleri TaxID=28197 RepID=UPI001EDC0864|nr:helix-turn-helix domain-containing protein [Aliarcobacter butzleri]MCG3667774.1 Mu transposase C-terminal domain-containing protein [Aliarcobacter butzleri]
MTSIKNEKLKLNRQKVQLIIGNFVKYESQIYKITQLIDFSEVIGINIETNEAKRLLIEYIKPVHNNTIKNNGYIFKDIDDIADDEWKTIEIRLNAIRPLLNGATRKEIEEHAKEINIHFTTLYRWLSGYKSTGTVTGLLSQKRGRKNGTVFIAEDIEKIIQDTIKNDYLIKERPSIKSVINKIKIKCLEKNLALPSNNTIRNRINKITQYEFFEKRNSKNLVKDRFSPATKKYSADYPLQKVQIDHTRVDLHIVDDEYRTSIGRPWLTLAIDIYSRMIVGYYLSLDAPSGVSVGMCIVNAILQKNKLLNQFELDTEWNVWGKFDNIFTDNGADFRSFSVEQACLANGIHINFRPIGKKEYGGHIERLIGTTMTEVHDIPGTTYSNIKEKMHYDSEGNACMTFDEFEKWLLIYITKIYQHNIHSGIKTSPYSKWKEGIFGTKYTPGIGYPQIPGDIESLTIDFLPSIERTVQKNGVTIDGLTYFDQILRTKIRGYDIGYETSNSNPKYIFKRDPRDISFIWFYDNIQQEYYKIGFANMEFPPMSLQELNIIKNNIEKTNSKILNEYNILEGYKELYNHVDESIKKTKQQKKMIQKAKNNKKSSITNIINEHITNSIPKNNESDIWDNDIPDFD